MHNRFIILLYMTALALALSCIFPPASRSQEYVSYWFTNPDRKPFIIIDKNSLTLLLIGSDGTIVRSYGIACAVNLGNKEIRGDHKTPEGRFPINQILNSADLSYDFKDGKGPIAGAYGPWFLRLDVPGFYDIGIHGTHLPSSIGSRCTEGCIRMKNEDIEELKDLVRVGMPVIILPDRG